MANPDVLKSFVGHQIGEVMVGQHFQFFWQFNLARRSIHANVYFFWTQ